MLLEKLINQIPEEFSDTIKNHTFYSSKYICLSQAILKADKEGLWAEFGTHSGETINIITKQHNKVYAFDSWEGLPEDWNEQNLKGTFNNDGIIPFIPNENTIIVQGWFEETLPKFVEETDINKISFLHLDADLYSSTKCVLDHFKPFFKGKCIMVFDEFFNYPDWENHEYKAFREFVTDARENILNLEILSYSAVAYHPVAFAIEFK
jgi:hypothetical protein